jgi:hypothetical protein
MSTHGRIRSRSFEHVPKGRGFLAWLGEMSRRRGFAKWLASYLRLSGHQLANLAGDGKIPGVARAKNGYNFDWGVNPSALAEWIRDRRRFRKGNRKRPPKRRKRVRLLDHFARAVRRAAWLAAIDKIETLQEEIRRAPRSRLRSLENSLIRLSHVRDPIARRLRPNGHD